MLHILQLSLCISEEHVNDRFQNYLGVNKTGSETAKN